LAHLGDLQLDLPGTGVPPPRAIAVAVRGTVLGPLAALGADQLRDLSLHQLLSDRTHRLTDHIDVLFAQHLPNDLLGRHPLLTGHRRPPSIVVA